MRSQVFHRCHDLKQAGHFGFLKTLHLARRQFWWPRMQADVETYVKGCPVCAMSKPSPGKPMGLLQPVADPHHPWQDIAMDFIVELPNSRGYSVIWTVVDLFSKQAHFVPCKGLPSARRLARMFLSHVYRIHGALCRIISDHGVQFTAHFWHNFIRLLGSSQGLSSAYHPSTNGASERANAAVERYLRSYVSYQQTDLVEWVVFVEVAYNNAVHSSTGFTPFRFLGRVHPVFHSSLLKPVAHDRSEEAPGLVTPDHYEVQEILDSRERKSGVDYLVLWKGWYISGITRNKANQLLLSPPNHHGSFLIRDSESNKGEYSLSVRNRGKVRHFRIFLNPAGSFYLEKAHVFSSLEELLAYYKANWNIIECPLSQPCVQKKPSEMDQWERPRSEFQLWRKMGEGCFGEVWEGMWKNTVPVAIKIMKQADMRDDFVKEIRNLKSLKHTRLIKLLAVCSMGEPVYIVTELMRKGNLHSYLNSAAGKELTTHHLLSISCQVADGMTYLEEKHIVHRDLAARNILVGDDLACKIADFGLARLLKDDIYSTTSNAMIPVKWTAPEAAIYQTYSPKSDVWSYGILLYEVFSYGQCPYDGMSNQETIQQISRGYRLPRPNSCSPEIYSIMLECWKTHPEDRPSFLNLRDALFSIYKWARHPIS
ncbi:tyrosine-protein kinase Srms-like [Protobothrops mucrosquamatus]|uniref:tyrosine-protein kinase Srms-like n=1 Tax=Protobothrops mucrosquamatus TaxID=103944 RepID=UPI000775CD8F|nr:tyrosine-protein kinase Srms-like [Protobothrops mucrosquamatus]